MSRQGRTRDFPASGKISSIGGLFLPRTRFHLDANFVGLYVRSMAKTIRPFRENWPAESERFAWPDEISSGLPLDLEIGCGVGWHPVRYAKENPRRRLIAIEHTREKFGSFQRRLEGNSPLPNLFAVHADAIRWTSRWLQPETIDRCFILYPNPEPKATSQRWFRMPYMHKLKSLLKPTGELILATNEAAYAEEALTWATEYWDFELKERRLLTAIDTPRTHFERKYLERGQTCFNLTFGFARG